MPDLLRLIEFNQYNFPQILELFVLMLAIFWCVVVAWVVRDAANRTRNLLFIIVSGLIALVTLVPGVLFYLMIRPSRTLDERETDNLFHASVVDENICACGKCKTLNRIDYKFCTNCGTELLAICPECSGRINPFWKHCANCNFDLKNNRKSQRKTNLKLNKPKINFPSFNPLNGVTKIFSTVKSGLKPIKFSFPVISEASKSALHVSTKVKVIAARKENSEVISEKILPPVKSASQKKKKGRGRPKGIKDTKPRTKRADAGKKRGSYLANDKLREI